jgi:hypothetical protein
MSAFLDHAKEVEWKRKLDKELNESSTQFALLALAFIAGLFLWYGNSGISDWEWINSRRFALRLWGLAFAAVFIGVSIERSSMFKTLWSFGFTKIVASIAVSALFIFSTGKASSLINSIFGIDASAFPFTRAFVAGLLAFQYSVPLLGVVAFFAIFHALDVAGYFKSLLYSDYKYDSPPFVSMAFLVLAVVFLFISWNWINRDFSEAAFPAKIYRLAHVLDFNSRHSCVNIKEGVSVVFVGSDQSKVLIDMSNTQTKDIESFVDPKISSEITIPKSFFLLPCNLGIRGQ